MNRNNFLKKMLIVFLAIFVLSFPIVSSGSYQVKTEIFEKELLIGNLPEQFDLRDVEGENYVTGIRDQGSYGTCWTFGTMASLEGNLLMTGNWDLAGETGEPDLSEAHLDWWNGFNTHNNDDDPGGGGLDPHYGGDFRVSSAYIIRGEGAIRESDAPYSNINTPPLRDDESYHHYYARDVEWYVAGENLENIEIIKYKLMTEGVISTALCYSGSFIENMGGYYAHYQPPTSPSEPNHGIAIVGWDDNKLTPAPEPGAWLCKNSWGNWGPENGYFWISYYDKCCGQHPEMGAVSFQDIELNPFENIYYYDYHGWRDTIPDISEVFNYFEAGQDETLVAVSFFTAVNDVDFEIIIYDDFEDGELKNELSTTNANIEFYGYHTIDLSCPVSFEDNQDYYVYVSLSEGGHPIDRTSDVPVLLGGSSRTLVKSDAKPGESFYKQGSEWYDLFNYEFSNPIWDKTANFCIKALTGEYVEQEPNLDGEGDLSWPDVPSGSLVMGDIVIENVGDPCSRLNWEIKDWPSWGQWTINPMSGYNLRPEEGQVTIEISVIAPEKTDSEFYGEINIVNKDDTSDDITIYVSLTTPKIKTRNLFIENFIQRFPVIQQVVYLKQFFNRIFKI
jgi:C1A family cysteine protease